MSIPVVDCGPQNHRWHIPLYETEKAQRVDRCANCPATRAPRKPSDAPQKRHRASPGRSTPAAGAVKLSDLPPKLRAQVKRKAKE